MTNTFRRRVSAPLPLHRSSLFAMPVAAAVLLAACADSASEEASTTTTAEASAETTVDSSATTEEGTEIASSADGVNLDLFFDGALAEEPTTEDCTLSDGAEASCYRITVSGLPEDREVGPFCPDTITDDAEAGGIWFDGENVHDVDGEFIENLAETYDDDTWQMFDEDGNVLKTETQEEFEAAARPDVDPDLVNHCVEGMLEWLENGEPITSEVIIPATPVVADAPSTSQGNNGITLDGVIIAASAPVDAILGAYTIAAFDDCGGHFNPNEGYHMHGAVDCSEVGTAEEGDTPMFGYAMDGYPVHSPFDEGEEPSDLDECNGHTTEASGYHYHANDASQNQVLECMVGQTAQSEDAEGGGGGPGGGGGVPPEDGGGPPEGGQPGEDEG